MTCIHPADVEPSLESQALEPHSEFGSVVAVDDDPVAPLPHLLLSHPTHKGQLLHERLFVSSDLPQYGVDESAVAFSLQVDGQLVGHCTMQSIDQIHVQTYTHTPQQRYTMRCQCTSMRCLPVPPLCPHPSTDALTRPFYGEWRGVDFPPFVLVSLAPHTEAPMGRPADVSAAGGREEDRGWRGCTAHLHLTSARTQPLQHRWIQR
mmetsp:Transcript_32594/g.94250  ORF Transcript_32594/g.94250 Transcript_32594/m.94250 type:complete len:206 (-) Transcript_32594:35-652(-)